MKLYRPWRDHSVKNSRFQAEKTTVGRLINLQLVILLHYIQAEIIIYFKLYLLWIELLFREEMHNNAGVQSIKFIFV